MNANKEGYPGFPQSRHGGEAGATKLPTVASATRIPTAFEIATLFDNRLYRDVIAMDGESGMQVARSGCIIRSAEEIATTFDPVALASVGSMDWGS